MSKGKRWVPEMDEWLRENYSDRENRELSRESGYATRTLERHAARLGLRKSEEFIREKQRRASREAIRWYEYMRVTGRKVKKKAPGGRQFGKGFRWDEETERKRVDAIRERSWQDRKRIIHGIKPIAKWKYKIFDPE